MEQFTVNVPVRDVDAEDVKNAFADAYGYRDTIDVGNGVSYPNPLTKEQFVTQCCTGFLLSIFKGYMVENAESIAVSAATQEASTRAAENIVLFDAARLAALPVNPFENFPTLTETSASITKGDVAEIQLLGVDPDNLPLTYEVINQPSNGTVLISGDELVYTPESSFYGQVIIGVKAFNGTKYSQITNIIVDVLTYYIIQYPCYKVEINDYDGFRHIDLMEDRRINIRFDLYSKMPIYKKIDVKLGLFDAIIGRGELNKFFMD
jgi:hypothetical protein